MLFRGQIYYWLQACSPKVKIDDQVRGQDVLNALVWNW